MNLRPSLFIVLILFAGLWAGEACARTHQATSIDSSTEIIVVTTSDWSAVDGTLRRFERMGARRPWSSVGAAVPVVVGKNGLGWGTGVISSNGHVHSGPDPIKKEGDGKAPAGVFSLSEIFGYAPQAYPGTKLPYVPLTASVECVDDTASKFYNRVLDRGSVSPDWNSSEHMLRSDELYRWGVVVDHNSNPVQAGAGSCIFMHIWRGPGQGTVGCTAMPREQLEAILTWLDPSRKPLLVQMPEQQYHQLQKRLKLPDLKNNPH